MKKILLIILSITMLLNICTATGFASDGNLYKVNFEYGKASTIDYDLDGDGVIDHGSIYEEEIRRNAYKITININNVQHEIRLEPGWIRSIFLVDLNTWDKTKEILFIYGYHSYSWFGVVRYEDNKISELNVKQQDGSVSQCSIAKSYLSNEGCYPETVSVNGDTTMYLAGYISNEDEYFVEKYQEIERGTLTAYDGEPIDVHSLGINVVLNGSEIYFDQPPIIQNDRTLVPMRKIFEELGCYVYWSEEKQQIDVWKNDINIISLWIDDKNMRTQNGYVTLDVVPQVVNERTLVPIRAISESIGAKVYWDDVSKTVFINY